jgi:hypothetical protein
MRVEVLAREEIEEKMLMTPGDIVMMLLTPSRAVDGRWTADAWAPLDGRNINGGIRLQF